MSHDITPISKVNALIGQLLLLDGTHSGVSYEMCRSVCVLVGCRDWSPVPKCFLLRRSPATSPDIPLLP